MTIFYAVEDEISRAVAERLIVECLGPDADKRQLGRAMGGFGIIKRNLRKYVDLAAQHPVLAMTDLDQVDCAPNLAARWKDDSGIEDFPSSMMFCVAVREVESWLLADREMFAQFLDVSQARIDPDVEHGVADPKAYVVQLAQKAPARCLREDLVPAGAGAKVGLGYNHRLAAFAREDWRPDVASESSISLSRTIARLRAHG